MEEVKPLDTEEIRRANVDLADRIEAERVTLDYNPEADVLTITIGEPQVAITEPLFDDIMYRVDPDTLKIVGIEIVAFFGDFVRRNKLVRKLLRGYLEQLRPGNTGVVIDDPHNKELLGSILAVVP
ncbi:MAG: DUF2283 domain-containing protein [SAR202 cluster bacterium]|nr:DUF2283 domain-containing protein [SAR202 cluster bacterium]